MWIVRLYHSEFSYVEYSFRNYNDATWFAKVAIEHFVIKNDNPPMTVKLIREMPNVAPSDVEFIKDEPPFEVDETEEELL